MSGRSVRPYRGRFAPSPTGPLHAGSLVAALASWLDARAHGGVWLVRIEDLDPPRETAGAAQDILATLAAFDLESDEPVLYQSARSEPYAQALQRLLDAGLAYACGCSRRAVRSDCGCRIRPTTGSASSTAPVASRASRWRARSATSYCAAPTACGPTSSRWWSTMRRRA
jgi:glutamyl/glutaminyl-tRNA synthetase